MSKKGEKEIYCISNIGTCSVTMIDSECFVKLGDIKTDPRPQKIVVDEAKNLFIACDRNDRITCIYNSERVNQTWDIPNNGILQVDYAEKKLYVCNTEDIVILNLTNGTKIHVIHGFNAAGSLKFDKKNKLLYVLDVLESSIKVYSTQDYSLHREYKNLGTAPSDFILGKEGQFLYIANKELRSKKYPGNISMVDIATGTLSFIDLNQNASITALEEFNECLYAANNGMHEIDVVGILNKECIAKIKTTLPNIQSLRISPKENLLLALSIDNAGKGALDRIDINTHVVMDSFIMEDKEIPYDIGIITMKKESFEKLFNTSLTKENQNIHKSQQLMKEKAISKGDKLNKTDSMNKGERRINSISTKKHPGKNIIAREVVSSYEDMVVFPEVIIELSDRNKNNINLDDIFFQKCVMRKDTLKRKMIQGKKEYSVLEFQFCIPYCIGYKEIQENLYAYEGTLDGIQKIMLYIPEIMELKGIEFVVYGNVELINPPTYRNNYIKFQVSALITTLVVVENVICVSTLE